MINMKSVLTLFIISVNWQQTTLPIRPKEKHYHILNSCEFVAKEICM